ncbi:alpha-ketoglutarate-dependent dioxygenase AlkB [Halobacteriovorax sp. HLS]|uniref:alpha-ketoglutarate-dependent dioxygenase AlkB family protein n=1 Tax=Halobacteriovorax sp. HLS TaxID=2234000 RepID=UPI000FD87A02|nr:alpha-ketoglutarate-dependent dioxygenase AlkB [Halobacteriovorax sp. HLS]
MQLLDQEGSLFYYEHYFKESFFEELFSSINWKQEHIRIFGKTVPTPRLQAWYGDPGVYYRYSGIDLAHNDWTDVLMKIKSKIEDDFNVKFNGALINLYRNGSDYSAWHSDNEKNLGDEIDIFSVSFGATRTFQVKNNESKQRIKIELNDSSLLMMGSPLQKFWKHELSKTSKDVGARVNITFRTLIL